MSNPNSTWRPALVSMHACPPPNKKNQDAPAHMPAPLALPSAPLMPPLLKISGSVHASQPFQPMR